MKIDPDLLDSIVTTRQAAQFIDAIDQLLSQIYNTNHNWESQTQQYFTQAQLEIISEYLHRNKISSGNTVKVERALNMFKDSIINTTEINLTFAIDLPVQYLINISRWFREYTGQAVFLNIKIEPNLIAGAIIEKSGKVGDYSLKKEIEAYFASNNIESLLGV